MARTGKYAAVLMLVVLLIGGCGAYYNTFYNARKAFNAAESSRKKDSRRLDRGRYQIAINKSLKVIEYFPNSSYFDDALYVLGVSYYYTEEYGKSERRLRELLANYPESGYIKEATVYLARAKLALGDRQDAVDAFESIFSSKYNRAYKAEAAMALGEYHYEAGEFDKADAFFRAVRDSLGTQQVVRTAQMRIADADFRLFRFDDALGSYLQILGMDPEKDEKYHALYQAAISSYRLLRIDDGLAYLQRLIDDELFYDSLGTLQLTVAEGYEYADDLLLAEETYRSVAETAERREWVAAAYYRLGLIYQYDYDQLQEAKEYYDKALDTRISTEETKLALERSSAIGKLEEFSQAVEIDSTTTPETMDKIVETQYRLAELYWFELNKPDTAILEMRYLIDSLPEAHETPRAMIALSEMYRSYYEDTTTADSILNAMLKRFPHSDFVPQALEILDKVDTPADTGYAQLYFNKAEDFLLYDDNPDSARYYFEYVADNFPNSEYYAKANFNVLLLTDMYFAPGDSSLIFSYQEYIDSFPGTESARYAQTRLTYQPRRGPQQDQEAEGEGGEGGEELAVVDDGQPTEGPPGFGTSQDTGYVDPLKSLYIRENGDTVPLLDQRPQTIEEEFEFPTEAYGMDQNDFYLYFQILLDFSGRVIDYDLKVRSDIEEINERASRTVASMTFDPLEVSTLAAKLGLPTAEDGGGYWFVYKYRVSKPDFLR